MIPLLCGGEVQTWLSRRSGESAGHPRAQAVREIIAAVRERGDDALRELAARFGDPVREQFCLTAGEVDSAIADLDADTRELLGRAAANIDRFARAVVESLSTVEVEDEEFRAGLDYRPVESVACYVPGGRHPLPSTALMTAVTARAAGVPKVALVSPSPHPAVLYAGRLAGVQRFYQMGGAQAVAALAFGTASVAAVDMVVGPGNAFVTEAKRQLQGVIGIDMLAGPSEVCVIADQGANPEAVALDLLAQTEHDPDARAYLVTWDRDLALRVREAVVATLERLDLPEFLHESLHHSALLVTEGPQACVECANRIAPEHLHLQLAEPDRLQGLKHYGGLFAGYHCTVPFGDYMAGPNHTLPTGGTARFSAGLSPLTFLRPQAWLRVDAPPPHLARDTAAFAELEGLTGHAAAARARL